MTTAKPASAGAHAELDATTPGPNLSFVIPACNEERHILATLRAIAAVVPPGYDHEVVVVDNGSMDRTPQLARDAGAKVVTLTSGTIARLRNEGVQHSRGEVLVFLDADIVLTEAWGLRMPFVLARLERDPRVLTGAACSVPKDASWLERWWFAPRQTDSFSHIGSGHMIMVRRFFDELGGFDETLETGEDFNISRRAVAVGGRISPDPGLKAEHMGYPRTLGEFMRREAWHGRSDFASVRAALTSKVALATLSFVASHVLLLYGVLALEFSAAAGGFVAIFGVCMASSTHKYRRQGAAVILTNTLVYYFYYAGRALAMLRVRFARQPRQAS
jgi:glycosyltransferase involved in cell wall biosynthesis